MIDEIKRSVKKIEKEKFYIFTWFYCTITFNWKKLRKLYLLNKVRPRCADFQALSFNKKENCNPTDKRGEILKIHTRSVLYELPVTYVK